jgi:DNA-binding MarR family transcriptional regulator
MARPQASDTERLRALVQTFVRSFGLLVTKETPCGHAVSPSYAHALMLLLRRERQRTSQSDLGAMLGIDKSNVARLCARMERARHIVQQRPPEDGRGRLVRLTRGGTSMAQRIEAASQERFESIMERIAPSQRRKLFESLELLNTALDGLGRDAEGS